MDMSKLHVSDWRPFSELKEVKDDISCLGYTKRFIDEHGLETENYYWQNVLTGVTCFREPLEVKVDGREILWRQNQSPVRKDNTKVFESQFGPFINHNNGEFESWLGRKDFDGLLEQDRKINNMFGRDDYFVEGNYCDMFDCGNYAYAVSNLMHFGVGRFKIIRIDKELVVETMYENHKGSICDPLEYAGRFKRGNTWFIIASGSVRIDLDNDKHEYKDRTVLFYIGEEGDFGIYNEWETKIQTVNSVAAAGDEVCFGQNKMITRLNIVSGETSYFTNKEDEEIAALVKEVC